MGKNKWWKPRVRGNQNWDPKVAKPPPTPRPRPDDDMVRELVSVVLKRLGAGDDDDDNVRLLVRGSMTFEAFTYKARQELKVAADEPLQLFVGPRSITPNGGALMSSFPKQDFLYISYV